ncbi:MAG TPA: TadE family protein [Candidatus Humimicrobiaceae bacterium]
MLKIIMDINKRKNKSKISGHDPDGQASLEFILIIPLLILIILAVSHFGLLIYQKNILEQAAREGARVIATTNSDQEAYACIKEVCSGLDQNMLEIKVSPESRASRKVGDMIEVTVIYKNADITGLQGIFSGKDSIIKAKSNMRMECY